MGERLDGIQEVTGSNPAGSTTGSEGAPGAVRSPGLPLGWLMSKATELMHKAVAVVEAATRRDRRALEMEYLDDRASFFRKYEEHLRKLSDEDKRALRGSR